MNGLLRKDLLVLKSGGKTYLFLILLYAVFSFFGNSSMFPAMTTLILLMLPMSSFSMDELARWDKFAAALPGGRRAVVRSKYQLLLLVFAGALVLMVLVGTLIYFFGRGEGGSYSGLIAAFLACAAAGLLLNCILYPFLFRYGAQKARIYLALAVGAILALLTIGFFLFRFSGASLDGLRTVSLAAAGTGLAVLLAAALLISYRVSRWIYDRKEF